MAVGHAVKKPAKRPAKKTAKKSAEQTTELKPNPKVVGVTVFFKDRTTYEVPVDTVLAIAWADGAIVAKPVMRCESGACQYVTSPPPPHWEC